MVATPSLAEIKTYIDNQKTAIDAISGDIPKITEKLDKIKIPHGQENVHNVVYVDRYGTLDWVTDTNNLIDLTPDVNGIYRFTASSYGFNNLNNRDNYGGIGQEQTAVNTITQRINANLTWTIFIYSSIPDNIIRLRLAWVI